MDIRYNMNVSFIPVMVCLDFFTKGKKSTSLYLYWGEHVEFDTLINYSILESYFTLYLKPQTST